MKQCTINAKGETMKELKKEALALYLKEDITEIKEDTYDENSFSFNREEYLVLTDEEADEKTTEYIMDSLWAFRPEFIANHSNIKNNEAIKALEKMQETLCEDANELVRAIIKDIDRFVKDAICADGRGHFLSGYDGEENEIEHKKVMFYIYRTN
jgi:hypothetical protein